MLRLTVVACCCAALFLPAAQTRAENPPEPALPPFTPADAEIGLSYPMPDEPTVSLFDIDLDGYLEAFTGNRAWRNNGRNRFEQPLVVRGSYFSFGDFDNDGDLDVFSTDYRKAVGKADAKLKAEHFLLRNDGGDKYNDVLDKSGLIGSAEGSKKPSRPEASKYEIVEKSLYVSRAHGFFDYDNDGNLDLFVGGFEVADTPEHFRALPSKLFKGDGAGHFEDVTLAAGGKGLPPRPVAAVAFCDFDNDGNVDIYVAVDRLQPNLLWRNRGDGTFEEIAEQAGATAGEANSRAVAVGDFDNDGDFDVFVVNYSREDPKKPQPRSVLLRNDFIPDGSLHFTDMTTELGLNWQPPEGFKAQATWLCAAWADLNNDGWLDLFVTESSEGGQNHPAAPLSIGRLDSGYSKVWLSQAGQSFVRVDADRNKLRIEDSAGVSAADFNNDGWVDLLVGSNPGEKSRKIPWFDPAKQRTTLLRSGGLAGKSGDGSADYLNVTLSARDRALNGAVVEITLDDEQKRRAVLDPSCAGLTTRSNQLHFGLGSHSVTRINVTLPGGAAAGFDGSWRDASLLLDISKKSPKQPQTISPWK